MKKITLVFMIFALIVLVGCQAKPDAIAMKLAEATNAQDLDGALKLFAEDAVVNTGGPESFNGKGEIQGWLEGMFADNFKIEIEILEVTEDKVVEQDTMTMDSLGDMDIDSLTGTTEITIKDGKIATLDFIFSEESLDDLQIASMKTATPTHADVAYNDDGDPMHTLDVYLPPGAEGSLPTLFALHGGEGNKEDLYEMAGYFTERGYAAVLPQIRPKNDNNRPLTTEDAFCSLAWVHSNADVYGFDPQRIFVFGYSMGGMLSAMLGTVDDPSLFLNDCPYALPESGWLEGVATYAAVMGTPEGCLSASWCMFGCAASNDLDLTVVETIFEELRDVPHSDWLENSAFSERARNFAQGLPLSWVDGSESPFLIIHGDDDQYVPSVESEDFAAILQDAGVDAELLLFPGGGHNPNILKICREVEPFTSELLAP